MVDVLTYQSEVLYDELSIVSVLLRGKEKKALIVNQTTKPSFQTLDILGFAGKKLTKSQYELATFISEYYGSKMSMVLELFEPQTSDICTDFENQTNQVQTSDICENSTPDTDFCNLNITLSDSQKEAYNFLKQNNPVLLFGDTGSGKSEIYFKLIEEVLNSGGEALFLMPEIALTMSMQKRVKKYFQDKFIVWHSKLTKKTKEKNLQKLFSKDARLVIGARSALFLPFNNLKLIIIDEEHDSSYKSSQSPLYNAKDLSLYLAKHKDIKVVLGSATPSLTSYYNYKYFRLLGTYFQSKKHFIYDEGECGINQTVVNEINTSLENGKQVMVFLPNRANFRQLECKNCKKRVFCPFCEVALSVHFKNHSLKCHYCNYSMPIVSACPNCSGDMLEAKKIGTAEVLNILQDIYKDKTVAKLDSDELTSDKKLDLILNDFNDKKIDILVGTQMISKGHDYLNVDLAVILGLDEYLFYPHYLAKEQTISLCKQIAGRAGRSGEARVLIQTHNKDFFSKYMQDYEIFLKDELEQRGDYPPFSRLLYIVVSNKNEAKSKDLMEKILKELLKLKDKIDIVGYGKCGIYYIDSFFRNQILIKGKKYKILSNIAKYANNFEGVRADIDPINFN